MTRKQSAHASQTTYRFLLSQPLVLVGLMGSGKTAVGSRLAEQLQMPFIDSDHEIEAQAGLSIRDIFDIGGEAKFRDLEYRVMKRLMTEQPAIIATGGGHSVSQQHASSSLNMREACGWMRHLKCCLAELAISAPARY